MNILITGSDGFIGRYLSQDLLEDKDIDIYGVDVGGSSISNPRYHPLVIDLSSDDWEEIIPKSIQVLVHLAQSPLYRDFPNSADDLFKVNIQSTFRLLEWCRKNRVKKFLFGSTGNVYKSRDRLLTETDQCDASSFYSATKLSAEYLIRQYSRFFQVIILRLFSVYGPGQKGMLIPNMIDKIKNGEQILLAKGKGLVITPIYVTDCIHLMNHLIFSVKDNHEDIFNIAGSEKVSLHSIVSLISSLLSKDAKTVEDEGEVKYLCGNNSRICTAANFNPKIELESGIKMTIGM
jgi:nucleoside-diphosphate-sugar epimerase